MRKAVSEEYHDPQIRRAKVVPTDKVDDTTMSKMPVYSDSELEKMGMARLTGLLRSDRISKIQKNKIMDILKSRSRDTGNDPPVFK